MAYPQSPVLMPEPFTVVFERPAWHQHPPSGVYRVRCYACGYADYYNFGVRFPGDCHWCSRGARVLVIWEAA